MRPLKSYPVELMAFIGVCWLLVCASLITAEVADTDKKTPADNFVRIIAHKDFPVSELSSREIQDIFLHKKTRLVIPGRKALKLTIVILKAGPTHEAFLKKYVKKTPSQYRNYWKVRVFSGTGGVPRSVDTEKKLIAYVARTKGAIGYISAKTASDKSLMKDAKTGEDIVTELLIRHPNEEYRPETSKGQKGT